MWILPGSGHSRYSSTLSNAHHIGPNTKYYTKMFAIFPFIKILQLSEQEDWVQNNKIVYSPCSTLHLRSESSIFVINFISVENLPSEVYQIFFFPPPELHVAAHMWNISDIKPPNWKKSEKSQCAFTFLWQVQFRWEIKTVSCPMSHCAVLFTSNMQGKSS